MKKITNVELKGRLASLYNAGDVRTVDQHLRGVTKAGAQREYRHDHPLYLAVFAECKKFATRKNGGYESFCQSMRAKGLRGSSPLSKRICADVWREVTGTEARGGGANAAANQP